MKTRTRSIITVIFGAALFGSMGIIVRVVATDVSPLTQSLVRGSFSLLFTLIANSSRLGSLGKVSRKDLLLYWVGGVLGFDLMLIGFTYAIMYTSIANSYFLLLTEPIFAAVLAHLFLSEKITRRVAVAIGMCVLGTFIMLNPSDLGRNLLGNLLGLAAGVGYAIYVVVGREMSSKHEPGVNTVWMFLLAIIFLLPLTLIIEQPWSGSIPTQAWLSMGLAGLINFGGYLSLNVGLKHLQTALASVLLLMEPVSSIGYALLFFGELPAVTTLIGAVVVMASVVFVSTSKDRSV